MATNGKLEAQITVPTGGWDLALTDQDAGPTTVTIPAGTYYHSSAGSEAEDFAATVATVANAGMGQTWACTVAAGEEGTGKYTMSCGGSTCTITFTDADAGTVMGFVGNKSGSTTYTSASQAEGLWIASYGHQKRNGGVGAPGLVSNQQIAINSNGNVFSVMGRSYKQTRIVWPMETRAKTLTENESTTNESFQTFLTQGIWGTAAWGTSTGPIRFYNDADTDATYGTFSALDLESWEPEEVIEHFAGGRWRVELPRLIEVPS